MKNKILLFLMPIVFLGNPFKAACQTVNVQDSLVLVDLYKSTNGTGWTDNANWLTSAPASTWYGLKIDNAGKVTGLNLSFNNLTGSLPTSLGNLDNLDSLEMFNNNLTGSLPSSLANLTNLQSLVLQGNKLTGSIPSWLGNLKNLGELYLNINNFSGNIPDIFQNLPNLQSLSFSKNQLSGSIPPSIGTLNKLLEINLAYNQLSGSIPDTFANLRSLVSVIFSYNNLSGKIPSSLSKCPILELLYLDDNPLTGSIPASFSNLSNISEIDFADCHLTGALPTNFGNFPYLTKLYLQNNYFTFDCIEQLAKLHYNNADVIYGPQDTILPLHFNNNTFSVSAGGTLGNNIYKWFKDSLLEKTATGDSTFVPETNGSYSVVVNNSIASKLTLNGDTVNIIIPPHIKDSLALVDLYNSTNEIGWAQHTNWLTSAPLSTWYGVTLDTGKRVTSIVLVANDLFGNIQSSIGNLDSLKYIVLSDNRISGNIPSSLGNLSNLQILNLSNNNQISGSIPSSLGNLSKLTWLNLGINSLTDSIPSSLGKLSNLSYLALESNQLSGNIPVEIGNLANLDSLYLGGNQLSGNIPSTLGNLKNLTFLSLTLCSLSDSVPSSLGNLTKLSYLNLGYNQLKGTIPASLGNLSNLQFLSMASNQLSGQIPSSLGSLLKLQTLELPNNKLVGPVPTSFASLPNVSVFDVSYNALNFSGLENLIYHFATTLYSHQAAIPIALQHNKLSVSAGGTLSNNTYTWYKNGVIDTTIVGDSTLIVSTNAVYNVAVTNVEVPYLTLYSDTLTINIDSLILPARPNTEYASYEYTDTAGWTHYYYNNNTPNDLTDDTLLLSLKKNGQDIGTIGDGTFAVKLVATAGAGSNTGVRLTNPLITNTSGYWVMNRYWQVTPTHEPAASVGVRFYYNNQDLKDVNGSYPTHNLNNNKLIFYKAVGGNPDPTTNLAGATKIISILPGTAASDTSWTYHALSDTTQYGEYSVASFSGGGGGGTGNNQALPVVLINFTASLLKKDAQLSWQTSQEVNADSYTVERSLTGTGFTTVGVVEAAGNSTITQSYKLTDYNAALLNTNTLYYRLKITDKDGNFTYSKVIALNIGGGNNALMVYPNPAKNTATIVFAASAAGKYAIEITDLAGKTIRRIEGISTAGSNTTTIDVVNYAQGTYIVKIEGDYVSKQSLKLVKQ